MTFDTTTARLRRHQSWFGPVTSRSFIIFFFLVGAYQLSSQLSFPFKILTGRAQAPAADVGALASESSPSLEMVNSRGFRFEVFGRVQGVFFRKYTKKKATELGLSGWVRNTSRGTVTGEVAGGNEQLREEMKIWLRSVGSPSSRIDDAKFTNLEEGRAKALCEKKRFEVRH